MGETRVEGSFTFCSSYARSAVSLHCPNWGCSAVKVSDFTIRFLEAQGVDRAFGVAGGAASHLFDSLRASSIDTIHMHHEQACTMAADGYARISGKPALVLVTNGPGVSNAITGVLGAFQDSIPMVVLSGEVATHHMMDSAGTRVRQLGVQEAETGSLVKSVVKQFWSLREPEELGEVLSEAWDCAMTGRRGPVWIEFPLNVQAAAVEFSIPPKRITKMVEPDWSSEFAIFQQALDKAARPVVVVGGGVHHAAVEQELSQFIRRFECPVVASWGAVDLLSDRDPLYFGNFGILGQRLANLAVQNADFLLILGCRMSIPNIGYNFGDFSPESFKVMVDIDAEEIGKSTLNVDLAFHGDLRHWLKSYAQREASLRPRSAKWISDLERLRSPLSMAIEGIVDEPGCVDAYSVVECVSASIAPGSVVVTDMGSSFTCTMQAFRNSSGSRLFTSSGTCSMGFGLPGAIGAYSANPGRPVLLIAGDGGLQMTIQELQTAKFHDIPLCIIVMNSNGYLAISLSQGNLFGGNYFGSTPDSGLDAPCFVDVARAYGIEGLHASNSGELLDAVANYVDHPRLCVIEVKLPDAQTMRPRLQSWKDEDGQIQSPSLDEMWPHLDSVVTHLIDQLLQ